MNANLLHALAADLRRTADALDEVARASNTATERQRESALARVRQLCDDGTPEAEALAAVADADGLPLADLRFVWRMNEDRAHREWRRSLPWRVADLTAAGVRDAEIGRLLGIPRQQVPRIRRRLREAEAQQPKTKMARQGKVKDNRSEEPPR